MKKAFLFFSLFLLAAAREPELPPLSSALSGLPPKFTYQIRDYINKETGFVTANIYITTVVSGGQKYWHVESYEGDSFRNRPAYRNSVTLNYSDFTTLSDERYNVSDRSSYLIESFTASPDGTINFFHKDKNINLTAKNPGNVYSRYAFLVSLSGFPFEQKDKVVMNVYMFEYGNVLPLRAVYQGKEKIKVPAGEFECYKLELAVDGVLGLFAPDKYYLYYTVAAPHHFVRFYQKVDDGSWLANELIGVSF
ncbi:MAG: DUF3108 domain-containing protein [Candidatus Margulisbacteria bacterium]|jgi:hypothetical protein|nr:DUF3108 domain-containing protein [Candidatus Margulisiibacteriota bacterium]